MQPAEEYTLALKALRRKIDLEESKPNLGDFVIQQNKIQSLLNLLIAMRVPNRKLFTNEWIKWLEGSTLGVVINVYQLCAHKVRKEENLMQYLRSYNGERRDLIHKINKVSDVSKYTVRALQLGIEIEKILDNLIDEEAKRIGMTGILGGS